MDQDQDPRALLRAVLERAAAITDPVERERVARELVDVLLPDARTQAKTIRQSAVLELRQGRSLREVGEMLGGLSTARVDQIAKGK